MPGDWTRRTCIGRFGGGSLGSAPRRRGRVAWSMPPAFKRADPRDLGQCPTLYHGAQSKGRAGHVAAHQAPRNPSIYRNYSTTYRPRASRTSRGGCLGDRPSALRASYRFPRWGARASRRRGKFTVTVVCGTAALHANLTAPPAGKFWHSVAAVRNGRCGTGKWARTRLGTNATTSMGCVGCTSDARQMQLYRTRPTQCPSQLLSADAS